MDQQFYFFKKATLFLDIKRVTALYAYICEYSCMASF